jgi:hypothetical protein
MKKTIIFVVLAMVLIGSCAAQSANNEAQRIIGTWVSEYGSSITVVFNANGTGTWNGNDIFYGVSAGGEIRIRGGYNNNSQLYLSPDGRRFIFNEIVFQKK